MAGGHATAARCRMAELNSWLDRLRRSWSLTARYEEMILELRCLVQAFRNGTR